MPGDVGLSGYALAGLGLERSTPPFRVTWSDDDIGREAADRLSGEPALPKNAVRVSVRDGWATLTGEVSWHFQSDVAARHVGRVWGVAGVYNQITLKVSFRTFISDRFWQVS